MANPVAQVYADALFAIGKEEGALGKLHEELREFLGVLDGNPDLKVFLEAPVISEKNKIAVANNVLGSDFSQTFKNFVCVTIKKGRAGLLSDIEGAMQELDDVSTGRLRASVTSATELAPEKIDEIRKLIADRAGKQEIVLDSRVDASLLGGLIIQYGDTHIDASLKGRLETIRHRLQSQGGIV